MQVLVIITESNIQFHDAKASAVLYMYIPDYMGRPAEPEHAESKHHYPCAPLASGISAIGDTAIVGSIEGCILVFGVWTATGQITFEKKLPAHRCPISDLSSDTERVVTADLDGNVFLWTGRAKKEVTIRFAGFNGFPCTAVQLWSDLICASYGSGHIRVFSESKRRLLSEVVAHRAAINSLDIAMEAGFLLSVADDARLRVWQLKEDFPWVSLIRNAALDCIINYLY